MLEEEHRRGGEAKSPNHTGHTEKRRRDGPGSSDAQSASPKVFLSGNREEAKDAERNREARQPQGRRERRTCAVPPVFSAPP